MSKLIFILFILCTSFFSCKNTKNAQTDALTEQEQKDMLRREAFKANPVEKVEVNMEYAEEEQIKDEIAQQEAQEFPDSLLARIQRTACYGNCPVYTISVYNTGFASYEGVHFVENIGYYGAYISMNVLNTLQNMAKEIGYIQMQDSYDNPGMTDVPSTITTLRIDGQLKTISNRDGGPEELREFEKFFDSLFEEVKWDDEYENPEEQ